MSWSDQDRACSYPCEHCGETREPVDEYDLAEDIIEALNEKHHETVGFALAGWGGATDCDVVVQTFPVGGGPGVDFLVKIERIETDG